MRRMIAPGVWEEMGPSSATGASTRSRIETGRLVGQMVPDAPAPGPSPAWAKRANTPEVKERQRRRWNGQRI